MRLIPNPTANDGQYAVITVTDTAGSVITVEYVGKRLAAAAVQSVDAEPEVLLTWVSEVPVAVSLVSFSPVSTDMPLNTAVIGSISFLLLVTVLVLRPFFNLVITNQSRHP